MEDAKTWGDAKTGVTCGSGNMFVDLGLSDAEERQTRVQLALAINGVIVRRRLTQADAAGALGVSQPKVSRHFDGTIDDLPHSHSIVPGGLLVTSYVTRLIPRTSLMMRLATRPRNAMSNG